MSRRPGKQFDPPGRPHLLLTVVAYLFCIGVLVGLVLVCRYDLFPAMLAAAKTKAGDPAAHHRRMQATALLILLCMLFVLFAGLLITYRLWRAFFPRPTAPRSRTEYIDAWAESGRRIKAEDPEEDPDESAY